MEKAARRTKRLKKADSDPAPKKEPTPEASSAPLDPNEARIAEINAKLVDAGAILGGQVKLRVVAMALLDFLEENARYMRNETFRTLVDNIKRDGALTSVPYCWLNKETGRYLILSGNHRVKAAQVAGHQNILIMFNDEPMSEQERIAVQLSHNAISGEDDPVLLKNLWSKLTDVDLKKYSGLDDKTLAMLNKLSLNALSDVRLDFRVVSFMFLPHEVERLDAIFQEAIKLVVGKAAYLASLADFERLLRHQSTIQSSYNLKNAATSLTLMLDIFEAHMSDLTDGWEKRAPGEKVTPVPLASIFGREAIPLSAAQTILEAVRRLQAEEPEVKAAPWRSLLTWAEHYLKERETEQFSEKRTTLVNERI